jgi:adenosylcobinamide kinase/adenosylcobinamide-phosphate guanylyltransferase
MQLVVGGAYAGKRRIVRQKISDFSWISAYMGDSTQSWQTKWHANTCLVLEGWEKWIEADMQQGLLPDQIRQQYASLLRSLSGEEQKCKNKVILIMLEVGRGIVPINEEERKVRDIAGWLLQDAATQADEVVYVWHGLTQTLKSN